MERNVKVLLLAGAALLSALITVGCGHSPQALAPETASSASASVAPLEAPDASAQSDRDETSDDARRATPIYEATTISKSGDYRLAKDIQVASGDGIVITASNVRLWLGDHRLMGPGNKLGRAIVIEGAEKVAVFGGRIERFGIGAVLVNSSNCRVRSLTVLGGDETANPGAGNPPQIGILLVNSAMNRIVGNRLRHVNLGLFVRGGESYRNQIYRNHVLGGTNGLLAICYNPASGEEVEGPREDRVAFNVLSRFGTGIAMSAGSAKNEFKHNVIRYFNSAYVDENGTNVFERNRTEQITP